MNENQKTQATVFLNMEKVNGIRTFNPVNRSAWRKWLAANHTSTEPVCLIIFKKNSKTQNVSYEEAVEEALCFGWIDNKGMRRDEESSYLQFSPRKEKSRWSQLNIKRAERMMREGLMTRAGQVFIDIAKSSGKWYAAEEADVLPPDLQKAFDRKKRAFQYFQSFPPFSRRMIIEWIRDAKRDETRERRIEKTVVLAAKNIRARP